jgi:DNA-binding beta-propeller fold protein YncE
MTMTHRLAGCRFRLDLGRIEVFDEPYGVVKAPMAGGCTSLDYPGQVVEIDPIKGQIVRTLEGGHFARGIALSADQSRLLVTQYFSGEVLAIELSSGQIADRWPGVSNDNLARQITIHPARSKAYLPHITRVTAVLAKVRLSVRIGDRHGHWRGTRRRRGGF